MRDGFVFYRSFYESAKALSDEDKLEFYDAIFEFALNQNETKTKPLVNAFINLVKPQIEANNRRYENGKKGGRPSKNDAKENLNETKAKPNNNLDETKAKPKEKEKEKEKEKDKEKEKELDMSGINPQAFSEWVNYKGNKYSRQGKVLSINFLRDYDYNLQSEIIRTSIMNGWKGLFAPKGKNIEESREWK
jgi:Family of unknown function (DUF6291)